MRTCLYLYIGKSGDTLTFHLLIVFALMFSGCYSLARIRAAQVATGQRPATRDTANVPGASAVQRSIGTSATRQETNSQRVAPAAAAAPPTAQTQVELVKRMNRSERMEYVSNFLLVEVI